MDKRKKKVLVVLCLGSVILVWRVYAVATKYMPADASASPAVIETAQMPNGSTVAGLATPATDSILEGRLAMQKGIADKPWGRNPFEGIERKPTVKPVAEKIEVSAKDAPPAPQISLTGVSKSGDVWLAAIDGEIVRPGDSVADEFTLRTVTRNSATLESKGWAYTFKLGNASPKITKIGGSHER